MIISILFLSAGCSTVKTAAPVVTEAEHNGVPMTRPEEVIASFEFDGDHVSFLDLGNGKILMCFFGDMAHKGSQSKAGISISEDGGLTWGKRYKALGKDGSEFDLHNGALIHLSDGRIGLTTNKRPDDVYFRTSGDLGHTWSDPIVVNEGIVSQAHLFQGLSDEDRIGTYHPPGL